MNLHHDIIHNESNKLSHWNELLAEWSFCFSKYCKVTGGDSPCLNKERANIGILSAAAWRCGLVTLEEWPNEKNDNRDGRNDLYIAGHSAFDDYIEAKWSYINIDTSTYMSVVNPTLEKAINDAKQVQTYGEIYRKIGVAFLCPALPSRGASSGTIHTTLTKVLSKIKNSTKNYDVIAWSFPEILKGVCDDNTIFPGAILIAKQVSGGKTLANT